jgi:O-succinylbenzoic acid--CoA ligase
MIALEPFDRPLTTPLTTADGQIERRSGWLVRARDGDVVGVGEATPLPGWTESRAACEEALQAAAERAAERDPETALAAVDADATPAARHGLSLALADRRARERGVSLAADLTSDPASSVPIHATLGDASSEETAERAREAVERGFDCVKCKVGRRSTDADADRLRAVREAVGDAVTLRIDANAAWDRSEVEQFLDACGGRVDLIEQPLAADDLAGHAALRDRIAIALDESLLDVGLDAVLDAGAADAVVLKPMALGGLDRARDAALRARADGVSAIVSTTVDAAVARTAAVHLAASLPGGADHVHGLATGDRIADDLGSGVPTPSDGHLRLPTGVGHGVRGVAASPELVAPDWPTGGLLHDRARTTPDGEGLVDAAENRRWSWRDASTRAAALAARLASAVEAGDRVGVWRSTPPETILTAFAVQGAGAVPVLLPDYEATSALRSTAERLGLRAIATDDAAVEADSIAPAEMDRIVLPSAGTAIPADGASGDTDAVPDAVLPETAVVLLTSGTTGDPAGVRLTHTNLLASAVEWTARLGVRPDDRWLSPLSPAHAGGFLPAVRAALTGTTLVTQDGFDPAATAAIIAEESITGVSLVPTMLARLLDADWTPPDHLRHVLVGGGPIDSALVERCADRGVPITPTYGLTETAAGVATATPAEAVADPGTVGRPHLFSRVVPVDDAGDPCPSGDPGELAVSGPCVTPGYVDPARTRAAFDDHGRFRTGDRGVRDADGRLRIVGRLDDRIATGGETVRAERVADALRAHPEVEDAAVVGLDDPEWGERVAALVTGEPDRDALDAHARDILPPHAVPKTLATADELPRTASGTVDRDAVRERCRADGTPL